MYVHTGLMSDDINSTVNYLELKLSIWRRPSGRE